MDAAKIRHVSETGARIVGVGGDGQGRATLFPGDRNCSRTGYRVGTARANCHPAVLYLFLKNELNALQDRKQALNTPLYIPLSSRPWFVDNYIPFYIVVITVYRVFHVAFPLNMI